MNIKHLNDTIYALERDYGLKLKIYHIKQSDVDVETGIRKVVKDLFKVTAVKLPDNMYRKFVQDIAYLAANKNFTYGGLSDYSTTKWVIRSVKWNKNIPMNNLDLLIEDNGLFYNLKTIYKMPGDSAFIISGIAVENAEIPRILELVGSSKISVSNG